MDPAAEKEEKFSAMATIAPTRVALNGAPGPGLASKRMGDLADRIGA